MTTDPGSQIASIRRRELSSPRLDDPAGYEPAVEALLARNRIKHDGEPLTEDQVTEVEVFIAFIGPATKACSQDANRC